jgi:predicted ATPase
MSVARNCESESRKYQCKLVVITGGPGAGKTAILELAKRNFCTHVAVLPEAATILFGGGFWRHDGPAEKRAAQRAIFHVQRELERVAIDEGKFAMALCDRGTLDGMAYWPAGSPTFLEDLGISREEEMKRYSAVIHLRTPNAQHGYNRSANPMRVESAEEAAKLDEKILKAWEGHPNRIVIESEADFLHKAALTLVNIRKLLPPECQEGAEAL